MRTSLTSVAYGAQHLSMLVPASIAQRVTRYIGGVRGDAPRRADIETLYGRLTALFERDLDDAEAGLYPKKLLFQIPVSLYAKRLPRLFADFPRAMRRRHREAWRDLPEDAEPRRYPPYFRRTFHWQTDGYLSRRSAELYDVGVEFLFAGTADVMRRRVVAEVSRFVDEQGGGEGLRMLDVACGTGRTLAMTAAARPSLKLYGLDLSPYYLQEARDAALREVADVSLVAENAESMPFADGWFDVVTSVYLFHELPRNARRRVFAEMFRVLRPGGRLVIEDSAQYVESSSIRHFLDRFPEDFHEPFYRDYLKDDLALPLAEAGFVDIQTAPHFVAKVVSARKPHA